MLLEQFGGANGELAAPARYFTQGLAEEDPGRKDLLMDIPIEELSHLEIVGSIIVMLNKGAKGQLAEGVQEEGELYRAINGAGNDSHISSIAQSAKYGKSEAKALLKPALERRLEMRSGCYRPKADCHPIQRDDCNCSRNQGRATSPPFNRHLPLIDSRHVTPRKKPGQ